MPHNEIYSVKNPLRLGGTSQFQRKLPALDPNFIKIDERSIADFLVYASDFARQVYYYNKTNVIDGNWQDFFKYDISFIIASIEKINPQKDKDAFQKLQQANPTVEGLYLLFQNILGLVRKLDDAFLNLPPDNEFRDQISRLTRSNLQGFLLTLWEWELVVYQVFENDGYIHPNDSAYASFSSSSIWSLGDINNLKADNKFFKSQLQPECASSPTAEDKLKIAYGKLNKQFTELFNVYLQVIRLAVTNFGKSLTLDTHEPHIALFIGFLYLYQLLQEDINKITEKHLNFYYKDVLQLKLKPAVPDKVHIYFELAKHVQEHKLAKGTRFLAGKDNSGLNVFYIADADTVLNKAQVETIKTIFVERDGVGEVKNIYAAPVANSQDGLGAEIEDEDKPSWMTFGSNQMPKANIGFAVASNELLLAEGTRKITLTINYTGTFISDTSNLKVAFSGEKGWIEPSAVLDISTIGSSKLKVEVTLNPEDPGVTPFDEKALGQSLGTSLPVMKIYVDQPEGIALNATLNHLKDIKITSLVLDIDIKGVENILAFNDLSLLDTKKSFLPFGVSPVEGSGFYVGSAEAFHKNIKSLNFNIEWENKPTDFWKHYLAYDVPGWLNGSPDEAKKLNDANFTVDAFNLKKDFGKTGNPIGTDKLLFTNPLSVGSIGKTIEYNEKDSFGQNSNVGFIKFTLDRDFEHDQYPNVLSRQLIALSKQPLASVNGAFYINSTGAQYINSNTNANSDKVIMPNEPYTPTIKAISLDYKSQVTLGSSPIENSLFIYIQPFENTYQQFSVVNNINLLPQLHKYAANTETFKLEGALMLGLKDLKPKQSLSILFQVAENTADADAEVAKVKWQYLSNNDWFDFKEYEITKETTNGFLTSGIITFAIPDKINLNNTILTNQLYWIRAWVQKDSVAVSEMINIHTQAIQVNFQDNSNDSAFLATPLVAGTIAKMETDDAAIDSINQNYESFGGRPPEKPLQYYTRVSERLRHKGRAVTIYDYERLVLEQFNDIYKVKCINHTNNDNQLAPGHVQVAVIPDLKKLKAVDRRQPKVTLAKLEEIRKYLEGLSTTFVSAFKVNGQENKYLHVLNPNYKKIRISFAVKFHENITAIEFYKRELRQAIIRFLSPWAFDDGAELNFGGKVFKSSIQGFVEQQSYVDYVMDFKLMDEKHNVDVNFIEADTARTILVPDDEVYFEIFDAGECLAENTITGDTLGYTTIVNDFIVNK